MGMLLNIDTGDGINMSTEKICIIEDELEIQEALKLYLENANYNVECYQSAEEFYAKRDKTFKGLYLVDWNLPGEPGINIVSKIREEDKYSPIFMVSAYSQNEDILLGLRAGADDYIAKPFSLEQLLARVENAHRKNSMVQANLAEGGDGIRLLPEASSFIKDGQTVSLTRREYIIFEKLFNNQGQPITRDELIFCFDKDEKMTVRNIDVHVFSLRKKIKNCDLVVETVWGKGYKLAG